MANGFFTDTTLCIGCKACEVACKQWNQLPADGYDFSRMSYDNTVALTATTWRHVSFIEQLSGGAAGRTSGTGHEAGASAISQTILQGDGAAPGQVVGFLGENRWLMMSDVCNHSTHSPSLPPPPTPPLLPHD